MIVLQRVDGLVNAIHSAVLGVSLFSSSLTSPVIGVNTYVTDGHRDTKATATWSRAFERKQRGHFRWSDRRYKRLWRHQR
jgi:hypothetical protein